MNRATVHEGDAREVLATLPEQSVHCCVTSPPYWGLRDYGVEGQIGLEDTPEAWGTAMVEVFRGVRRVLRDDGTCWVNVGDAYATSGARGHGGWDGNNKAADGTPRQSRQTGESWGEGGGGKPKDLIGLPWLLAFALRADGWWLRSEIIWQKPNPMPESCTDRPTKSHEHVFLLSKRARYFYDADAVREAAEYGRSTSEAGFRGGSYVNNSTHDNTGAARGVTNTPGTGGSRNLRDVWTIATEAFPGAHFATFPRKLVEPCVKAGCPEGGTVLDPFAGSGTTGLVATGLGRDFIGIELNPEYAAMARKRIKGGNPLFTEVTP